MTLFEWLSVTTSAVAAVGTILATVVALWLARSSQRVKLKATVGVRETITAQGQGTIVVFNVTNVGERPVTISMIGWRIRKRRYLIPLTGPPGDQVPKTIAHGENAMFIVLVKGSAMWIPEFIDQVAKNDLSESSIRALRGQFHTSVGYSKNVVPEDGLLDELRALRPS